MNVKLTLSLDKEAVEKGKRFAASQNTSLSQVVQTYFIMLDRNDLDALPVSQKLESLLGVGAGNFDETDYRDHVDRKYE